MRGTLIVVLFSACNAFLWSGNRTLEISGSTYVVGHEPVTNASSLVYIQDQRVHTPPGVLSLHSSSDLWNHYRAVTLTSAAVTFSTEESECRGNDTDTDYLTHDIVVTSAHRCVTKHYRWRGSMVVLFALVTIYLYLTTHQEYGKRNVHPRWSLLWHVMGLFVLMPTQSPYKFGSLLIGWSRCNSFLLMVILEAMVMILCHGGLMFSTVVVNAYIVYQTTSRIVQRLYRTTGHRWRRWYLWIRSVVCFGLYLQEWYQHVVYDVYVMNPMAMSAVTIALVLVLAVSRRSNWVILTFASSSPRS